MWTDFQKAVVSILKELFYRHFELDWLSDILPPVRTTVHLIPVEILIRNCGYQGYYRDHIEVIPSCRCSKEFHLLQKVLPDLFLLVAVEGIVYLECDAPDALSP